MKRLFVSFVLAALCCSSAFAFEFNRMPAGLIKGARLSRVSDTAIKIGVGYGENMGSYWELTATDTLNTTGYTLTGLTTTTNGVVHYIYIDRNNSSFPNVTITNSTTAPSWSDDFMGWYNANNRCIGAVWIKANGTIIDFTCPQDDTYTYDSGAIATGVSPTTSYGVWTTVNVSGYLPTNIYAMRANYGVNFSWSGTMWAYSTAQVKRTGETLGLREDGTVGTLATGWLDFPRGASKQLDFMAWAQSTNGFTLFAVMGYKIER